MEPWTDWDSVMQDDYLAEIDLTVGEQLVMEIRRKVLDATKPAGFSEEAPIKR